MSAVSFASEPGVENRDEINTNNSQINFNKYEKEGSETYKDDIRNDKVFLKRKTIDTDSDRIETFSTSKFYTDSTQKYYIVQFDGIIKQKWKQQLENKVVNIINYIPNNAYLVKMDGSTKSGIEQMENVQWVGVFKPAYKISDQISNSEKASVNVTINIFKSSNISPVVEKVEKLNGSILQKYRNSLNVVIDKKNISQIAELNQISYIQQYTEPTLLNNKARQITNVSYVETCYNLNGDGQVIAVADSGIDSGADNETMHPDLNGSFKDIINYAGSDAADHNGHGTHVTGTVTGNGSARGAAPKSDIVFQALGDDDGNLTADINIYRLFSEAYNKSARIHTNSWGFVSELNDYGEHAKSVDEFMWDHKDMLILFAAGNEGDTEDNESISRPSTAKNCLTVGATENNRSSMGYSSDDVDEIAYFSSRGPTNDSRIKPDVVAPGTNILSTKANITSAENDYTYMSGTSMATPHVAGTASLVRQYYMDNLSVTPSASLIKTTLINGAYDITPVRYGDLQTQPNYVQGWGRLDVEKSIKSIQKGNIYYSDGVKLNTREVAETKIYVNNSSNPLKVTIGWTDYPGESYSSKALINDLDLTVIGPNGTDYYGNSEVVTSGHDRTNNIEEIDIMNPDTGVYTIKVDGYNVPQNPQPFSMVISGSIEKVKISSIEISPQNPTIYDNQTVLFNADIYDKNGNKINETVYWSSNNTTVGTINSTGYFTANVSGTANITANKDGTSNSTTVTVEKQPPELTNINVTPLDPIIYTNQTLDFDANTTDQYGNEVDVNVNWSVGNDSVGNINDTGTFTPNKTGITNITAKNGSIKDVTNITVKEIPYLDYANITVNSTRINANQSSIIPIDNPDLKFSLLTKDQYGDPYSFEPEWYSNNTTVGTINQSTGVFEINDTGLTKIYWTNSTNDTITGDTIENNITFDIQERKFDAIKITNVVSEFRPGNTHDFNATPVDQFGDGYEVIVNWTSSNLDVGTINNSTGVFNAVNTGSTNITAKNGSINNTFTIDVVKDEVESSTDSSSSGSSGSGGGAGGGNTGEEYENIKEELVQQEYVNYGEQVSYEFRTKENKIKRVQFEAKKTAGKVETRIEVLKDKSALVDENAPDKVYQNMNIWVGKAGFNNNIKNASIDFDVEKSWIEENDINESTIKMCRYHDDKWNKLQTQKLTENETVIKYRANTPGFSPFAITGENINKQDINTNSEDSELDGSNHTSINDNQTTKTANNTTMQSSGNGDVIGIGAWDMSWLILAIISIVVSISIYIKKRGT
ncbi:peptidase S8 and S53 subtilisin kexin sedolisin [Methanohalobium evestigatum Z-7303]|uniref:Peptidase S8 and S53 subtilisin kexin sedolisin n=1 Tax=Methanohalobium evestigatum (strain ATCC BAA-1072 / DSM 3721 / NBRC 107634 / OCM 161 / Z-7303) TaxID=644295 RepID=D7E7R1_METEZ|nr:PGF-pre-PGF domain-containing protein [Methanohalobium evestigatum]ADI74134.1 peptidase S8 and S53 subtilisin kexin sedolisin [Methanohalobium evestigatum Z-7303]